MLCRRLGKLTEPWMMENAKVARAWSRRWKPSEVYTTDSQPPDNVVSGRSSPIPTAGNIPSAAGIPSTDPDEGTTAKVVS